MPYLLPLTGPPPNCPRPSYFIQGCDGLQIFPKGLISSHSQAKSQKSQRSLSLVIPIPDEMATKTQFAAAFLLLAMMSSSYASAQLLTCPIPIVFVKVFCGVPIISLTGICCNLLKNLTANQTANCLCQAFKFPPFIVNLTPISFINSIIQRCGKNFSISACP